MLFLEVKNMDEKIFEFQNQLIDLIRIVCKEEIEKHDKQKSMDLFKGIEQLVIQNNGG